MIQNIQTILDKWLEIDFYYVADKIGFIKKDVLPDKKLIMETIRCLDYITTRRKEEEKNITITLIALMWTYIDKKEYDIKAIVIKFLSRIGYPTSAIIVDDMFDKDECKFSAIDSLIDQITIGFNQMKNEVNIGEHTLLLTDFQKRIWDVMDNEKVIGISAPTSAGKSYVILMKVIQRLNVEKLDVVYIVPTLSLLNQVTEDFNNALKLMKINGCKISNTFTPNLEYSENRIYVLTQEKALTAFGNEETAFSKKLILIADEIQNIERIKDDIDQRAKILFDTLMEFRYKENVEQIIISGPRINEIDKLGTSMFGVQAENVSTKISPVLNLTYSICKIDKKYYLKQYCALKKDPMYKEIENPEIITGYGKKVYDDNYLEYLNFFVNNVGNNQQNIIFSPTSTTARKIACYLSQKSLKESENNELVQYYSDTIHKNYTMCKTLEKGIAYHHGKLPMHVRRTLEKAIVEKKVNNVVCTTTLMQGVNMPAQNIIVRNPHLYLRKTKNTTELSNYEMANLRGRAGRLLKDFIGRTYVLDESAFADAEGYEQQELFEDVSKELPAGYEERFEEYRNDIEEVVVSNKTVDSNMGKYGYLVSYIRQSVLRYGKESQKKMQDVGIKLKPKQVAAIMLKLENLTVPRDICLKNRYWDPFILQKVYEEYSENVPNSPFERGARAKLDRMMKFMRDNEDTSAMYEKYIPRELQRGASRSYLINLCMKWSKEVSLHDILQEDKYNGDEGAEEIEKTIQVLQKVVSFNVPLLLKPIFDIKNPDSIFLSCMQAGCIKQETRKMTELGIPRETALYLYANIFKQSGEEYTDDEQLENKIRSVLSMHYNELPFWIKSQLDFLV